MYKYLSDVLTYDNGIFNIMNGYKTLPFPFDKSIDFIFLTRYGSRLLIGNGNFSDDDLQRYVEYMTSNYYEKWQNYINNLGVSFDPSSTYIETITETIVSDGTGTITENSTNENKVSAYNVDTYSSNEEDSNTGSTTNKDDNTQTRTSTRTGYNGTYFKNLMDYVQFYNCYDILDLMFEDILKEIALSIYE